MISYINIDYKLNVIFELLCNKSARGVH